MALLDELAGTATVERGNTLDRLAAEFNRPFDPEEEHRRVNDVTDMSTRTGLGISGIDENYEEFRKPKVKRNIYAAAGMGGFDPGITSKTAPGRFISETIQSSLDVTNATLALGDAKINGQDVGEAYENWQAANRKAQEVRQERERMSGPLSSLVLSNIEVAAPMIKSLWEAVPAGVGGGIAGAGIALAVGQVPPLTVLPEEVGTVPAGAVTGMGIGITASTATFWYRHGVGEFYGEMLQENVNPKVAGIIAPISAIPYAAIEFAQIKALTPGLRAGVRQTITRSVTKVLADAAKRHGTTVGIEVLEEIGQEAVKIASVDAAKFLSGQDVEIDLESMQKRASRLMETGIESMKSMALLPLPGTSIDIATGLKSAVPSGASTVEQVGQNYDSRIEEAQGDADKVEALEALKQSEVQQLAEEQEKRPVSAEKPPQAPTEAGVTPEKAEPPTPVEPSKAVAPPPAVAEGAVEPVQPKPVAGEVAPEVAETEAEVQRAGITAEDFELKPEKMAELGLQKIAMKIKGEIFAFEHGEAGVFNHADVLQKSGVGEVKTEDITPGFIDTQGRFIEQFEAPPILAEAAPEVVERAGEKVKIIKTSIGNIEIPAEDLDVKWDKALEVIFDYGNQEAAGKPNQPDLTRSLSMGDTVEYEGKNWLLMPQGWQDVSQFTPEQIDKIVGKAKIPIPPKPAPKGKEPITPVEKPEIVEQVPVKKKRVISQEAYEQAKKRLIDRGTFRMGVDPTGFVDLVTVGAYHFESGVRTFKEWSKKMVEEFGKKVQPQLKTVWNDVKSSRDPDIVQVRQAIKTAKLLTPEVQEKQRKERRRRVGQLAAQQKAGLKKPGSAEQALKRARGALKGPLTEYKGIYESIRTPENAQAIDNAFRSIGESDLPPLTLTSTEAAFTKLVDGDALTLGEASLLEQHFGRNWGKLLQSRIPRGDRLWQLFQEAINVPRTTLASGDVSGIGRQARPLGQIHPALFAEMVAKYHKAFWSQESAEALERQTKQTPYYQEAKDDGVLELPEWGLFSAEVIEREERFAGAQIAEKIPGIGIVVRASERSFVTALNWFRVAVYSQIRTQEDIGGIKTTKEQRARIASRINDLSGRSHIKRTAAAKAIQPLLNTLFSARFTISRFKPIVTLPADAVRSLREGKLSTELKMGAGALMSLAATNFLIMYLVKLAGDDDEVETEFDLRATDGGKSKIGPTRIDLWSGYLQPAQLMVRLATGERKSAAGTVFDVSRTKIMQDFVRSKLNPQAGLVVDAYTGETFIGERILQPPDPEKGPGRILTGIGVPSWLQGVGRGLLWNRMMFLTVQDTADAYMDSGAAMAAVAGMLAWSGTGVTTYLPRASTQLIIEQNKMANEKHGENWEELTPKQQDRLSKTSTLQELERKKKVERNRERLDLSFVTGEANKARERIRRELPSAIQKKLDALGIRISTPSRRLGEFRLSDKRYEFYQAEVIKGLKDKLPSALKSRNPERSVPREVDRVKGKARTDLRRLIKQDKI